MHLYCILAFSPARRRYIAPILPIYCSQSLLPADTVTIRQAQIAPTVIQRMLRQDISETELRRLSDEELKPLDQKVGSIRETVKDEQHYGHRMREGSASEAASELKEKIDSCLQHPNILGRLGDGAAVSAELAVKVLLPQQSGRLRTTYLAASIVLSHVRPCFCHQNIYPTRKQQAAWLPCAHVLFTVKRRLVGTVTPRHRVATAV